MNGLEMVNAYKKFSATDNYIVGGICGNVVKFAIVKFDDLMNNLLLDKGSNKERSATTLRFSFCGMLKKNVTKNGVTLCDKDTFEKLAKELGNNKGKAFEKLVTEFYNQVWTADNTPFYVSGDININGVEYQIKTHKATFTNEKTLQELAV